MKERWLITGATGQLGGHLLRQLTLEPEPPSILALARSNPAANTGIPTARVDLADANALHQAVLQFRPTHIMHVAAMAAVGDCYQQPRLAEKINIEATRILVEAAKTCDAGLIYTSTDMVFAGTAAPYRETDAPDSQTVYGRTKAAAERVVEQYDRGLAVRVPLMYGFACSDRPSTFANQVKALRSRELLRLFTDEHRTPVWFADAAEALITLARSDVAGLIHVAGPERLSRCEIVEQFAKLLDITNPLFERVSRLSIETKEPRPADLSLDGSRFARLFPEQAPGPIRAEVFAESGT